MALRGRPSQYDAQVRRQTDRPFGANFVLSLIEDQLQANLEAALAAQVPVISTFWGDPAPVIARIHDAGALALHTVGSAQEARRVFDQEQVAVLKGCDLAVLGQVGFEQ